MNKSKDCNDNDIDTCSNHHRLHCFCHNISIKIHNDKIDHTKYPDKEVIPDQETQCLKRDCHIYNIGCKSIYILDFSAVIVNQSAPSLFHITCINCQDDFLIHSYENYAILKILKTKNSHISLNENQANFRFNEKATMKFIFPLELRKFCAFEYIRSDENFNQNTRKNRYNQKKNKNAEIKKNHCQEMETKLSFEKKIKKIENNFEDPFGAVFFQDLDPIVGPYAVFPVLNWNAMNVY